jgi:ABC-type multidrug transport system fused ATPase/permease subunit
LRRRPKAARSAFDNVDFAYHERAEALERISMDIPPGKKIALVGPSGAGKSTIFNLLLRFYDVDAGRSPSTARTSAT